MLRRADSLLQVDFRSLDEVCPSRWGAYRRDLEERSVRRPHRPKMEFPSWVRSSDRLRSVNRPRSEEPSPVRSNGFAMGGGVMMFKFDAMTPPAKLPITAQRMASTAG